MKIRIIACLSFLLAVSCYSVTTTEYIYRTTDGVDQNLKVYVPDNPSCTNTCLVLFHGGGWSGGDLSQFDEVCAYFATRGLVSITANYRVLTEEEKAALPEGTSRKTICVMDANSCIRWVKSHAALLGIDPDRVIGGGCSAGGHISVLSVLDDEFNHPGDPIGIDTSVMALLLWNPAFTRFASDSTPEVNVFTKLDKPLPPSLFLFGAQDGWKPAGDELIIQLRQRGDHVQYWVGKDVGHNFWVNDPWLTHTIMLADRFLVSQGLLESEGH